MREQSHILNRSVIFTEIPGNVKLPSGTRLTVKSSSVPEHEVLAITPEGQRYEFKSIHIANLIKTPWVDSADPVEETTAEAEQTIAEVTANQQPEQNPYTIGDVASVEEGVNSDMLPRLDVTGTSSSEKNPLEQIAEREAAVSEAPVETEATEEAAPAEEVTSVAEGINNETLPALDVTGSSNEAPVAKAEKKSKKKA